MAEPYMVTSVPEVVILCGGRGTRLAPDTDVLPKPLVRVGGRPILWHIMAHFASYGLNRFVLCLGYKGELIRDYFLNYYLHNNDFTLHLNGTRPRVVAHAPAMLDWQVTCADTGIQAQTGARIYRIARYIRGEAFFCTYGDGVSDVDLAALLAFHRAHGRIATVTGVHPPARFGEFEIEDGIRVTRFVEKPHPLPTVRVGYVNGGFFVFNRAIFDYLTPDDDCVLEQAPLRRLAADDQLRVFKHDGFWQCMDTPKDRDILDAILQTHQYVPDGERAAIRQRRNGV
ncbi:MAG TPA: glucose-1-phosphate cytidylyltransferase [Chloroflexota bacterium]|nr:glucose-1-phosphate cytidylyltransferase [Chloroflexota bacterium]